MKQAACVLLLTFAASVGTAQAQEAHPGRSIYVQFCATCHGEDLKGGMGSNLVNHEWAFGGDRDEIVQNIKTGLPERGMPPFGETLSDEQINHVVDYIDQVASGSDPFITPTPDSVNTLDYAFDVQVFARGLELPWGIDFTDQNTALITERPGRLRVVRNGELMARPVAGTPEVLHEGQGGLLDVAVDPNYSSNGWIYLAYSHALPAAEGERAPAMTRIVRGRIDNHTWTDQEVLFEAPHDTYRTARQHYGSRIVFDPDGYLYFSIGDRGAGEQAQDLSRPNGKVYRINRDGSVPPDNPFVGWEHALPAIYSYGHRNPQGLAIHPVTGELWGVEHGPFGGDELNRIQAGRNYGWPVITYGINYNQTIITEERRRLGMEQPIFYWRPSIAVSGLAFYGGSHLPYWSNNAVVSALRNKEVRLVQIEDGRVMHEEVILKGAGRVREAVPGPDGAIYAVLNDPNMIVRMVPILE